MQNQSPEKWLSNLRPKPTHDCLSDFVLDGLLMGTLSEKEQVRAESHIAQCNTCQERHEKMATDRKDFKSQVNVNHLVTLAMERKKGGSILKKWLSWWGIAPVSLAAAAAVLMTFVVIEKHEPTGVLTKGAGIVKTYVKHGTSVRELGNGELCFPGDALRFELTSFSSPFDPVYLAILSLDGANRVSTYAAKANNKSITIDPAKGWVLDGSVVLDDTLGKETLFVIRCPKPFDVRLVQQSVAKGQKTKLSDAILPFSNCILNTMTFIKASP